MLGAFQVADNGDIANWATSENDTAPAVGGAMDLATGAKRLWVLMEHTTKDGTPKLVTKCTYPLTAPGAVKRVYTNLATIDVTEQGFVVLGMAPGLTFEICRLALRRSCIGQRNKVVYVTPAAEYPAAANPPTRRRLSARAPDASSPALHPTSGASTKARRCARGCGRIGSGSSRTRSPIAMISRSSVRAALGTLRSRPHAVSTRHEAHEQTRRIKHNARINQQRRDAIDIRRLSGRRNGRREKPA